MLNIAEVSNQIGIQPELYRFVKLHVLYAQVHMQSAGMSKPEIGTMKLLLLGLCGGRSIMETVMLITL